MSNTEEKAWERSFQTKPRLSPEEAHRVVVLRQRLTALRYLSSEYLLRRAVLSGTKSGRTAWESVWALLVFVEHQKRFPRQGELYPYLHKVLDESNTLEDLKLPEIDSLDLGDSLEAQKGTLESLVNENLDLRSRLSKTKKHLTDLEEIDQRILAGELRVLAYKEPASAPALPSAYRQAIEKEVSELRALLTGLSSD